MDNYKLVTNPEYSYPENMSSSELFSGIQNLYSPVGFTGNLFDPEQVRRNEMVENALLWKMDAEWNSAPEQMARAKEAGINLNTASGAIAGNGTSGAAPAEPQSQQGAAANTLEKIAGAAGSIGNAGAAISQAKSAAALVPSAINLNEQNAAAALAAAGFDEAQTAGILIDNKYKDMQNIAGLTIKQQEAQKMEAEWNYIGKQLDYLQKEIDSYDERIKASIELQEKQALLAEKQAKESEMHAEEMRLHNDFFSRYGYDSNSPTDVALRNVWEQEGNSPRYQGLLKAAYNIHYQMASGSSNAAAESSWLSRPESPTALASQIAHDASGLLHTAIDKVTKGEPLSKDETKALWNSEEMRDGYDDYRSYMRHLRKNAYQQYRDASLRHSDDQLEKWQRYKEIDDEYKSLTFERWLGTGGNLTHQPFIPISQTLQ